MKLVSFKRTVKKLSSIFICTTFVVYVIEKGLNSMYITMILQLCKSHEEILAQIEPDRTVPSLYFFSASHN